MNCDISVNIYGMKFFWIAIVFTLSCVLTVASTTRRHSETRNNSEKRIPPKPAPIIDGALAGDYEFPYIVVIGQEGYLPHGAGVIIDEQWILTCRHVVLNSFNDKNSDYFNLSRMAPLLIYPKYDNNISQYYRFPGYMAEKLYCHHYSDDDPLFVHDADLALIKLAFPIALGNKSPYNIQKIKIYSDDMYSDYRDGYDVRIAGWGQFNRYNASGHLTDYLRKAEIPNRSRMHNMIKNIGKYIVFRPWQQIPLYFPNHCACTGDSGGPAVVTTVGTGEEYLFGIMSWVSTPFCQDRVFVQNLFVFKEWINEVMRREERSYEKYHCSLLYGTEYNV
ncbi:mite allergen Eur m 3-like [Brevipalpus obovatus]|uniref:mite allergen Eur m 3-like n=1 Tax=Brevipalpus obovatus TaxID=246614 RepID=UPI003D9E656D